MYARCNHPLASFVSDGGRRLTESKKQLSTAQLLDLIIEVEKRVDHFKPLITLILSNPCVDMNDYLRYDKVAGEQLTKMPRMLMAAASEKDFSIISFMLDDK